ncbi:hypothetical protein [Dyadobacter arcticus]|uniref:Na+/H+ antiporter n=1 Tax=Dyadobacter arcticus TaxID=1078754 RepID=A0ABX0UMZ5_9BACT|nr:hypothetical protein [Dyadobacter arcticus]NIJ54349.1 hypothetical protein [Dyadobacter arcticus]
MLINNGQPFPQRNLISFITFVVILVTLVFQGLTLPFVIKWMNLRERDYDITSPEQDVIIRRKLAQASLDFIDEKYSDEIPRNELLQGLKYKLESDIGFLNHVKEENPLHSGHDYVTQFQVITKEYLKRSAYFFISSTKRKCLKMM